MFDKMLPAAAVALLAVPGLAQAQMADALDTDADGVVTTDEFATTFPDLAGLARYDADGSGAMDEAEWAPMSQVAEFGSADLNGDGGVDLGEVTAIMFTRYDGDASGAIEAAEMPAVEADLAAMSQ